MRLNHKVPVLAAVLTLVLWTHSVSGLAETAAAPPPEKPIAVDTTDGAHQKKYSAMLRVEREALERQAERHIASMEKLYDRGLYVIGAVLMIASLIGTFAIGLFFWQFGKTKKELRDEIKTMMESRAKEAVEKEAHELRKRYQALKDEVDDLNSYKTCCVRWVVPDNVGEVAPIVRTLRAFGIQHVELVAPSEGIGLNIERADLVILTFDGTDSGRQLMGQVVDQIRNVVPPVPLVIYTYDPGGKEHRINDPERKLLGDFWLYIAANFPATLITHTLTLLRRRRAMFRSY